MKKRIDQIIIGIAIVVFTTSIFLLINDRWLIKSPTIENHSKLYGLVGKTDKEVKRRVGDDFVWIPAKVHDHLFYGDSVYTGDNATLEIDLIESSATNDLGKILVAPNSLIVLKQIEGLQGLDIQSGAVQGVLADDTKLNITNQGSTIQFNGKKSAILIATSESGQLNVKMISGQASVISHGKLASIEGNQEVKISTASGAVSQIDFSSISLITPSKDESFSKNHQKEIHFSWSGDGVPGNCDLEIAQDTGFFKTVLKKNLTKANSFDASVSSFFSNGGRYYWRISSDKAKSEAGSFKIHLRDFPSPKNPPDNAELKRIAGDTAIHFEWQDDEFSQEYKIQLSADKNFQNPFLDTWVNDKFLDFFALNDGHYFWRVQRGHENTPAWSPIFSFTLRSQVANLLLPKDGQAFNTHHIAKGIEFKWEKAVPGSKFILEIASNGDFTKPVFKAETNQLQLIWKNTKPGSYSWRVQLVTPGSAVSISSTTRKFQIF